METLPLDCDCGCTETEEINVYKDYIRGIFTPVEWDLHCKKCGRYLGHFAYGHWEYQEIGGLGQYGNASIDYWEIWFWKEYKPAELFGQS